MRSRHVVIALAALAISASAMMFVWNSSRPDASTLLIKSARRMHHIDYTGVVRSSLTYYGESIDTTTRVYHKGSGDRMEYMSTPLKGAVVIDTGHQTFTYSPKTAKVVISPQAAQSDEMEKVRLLLRNYRAELAGRDRVAGRPALVVDIVPKRQGNPSKRMWIDSGTLLVLKQEDRSASGSLKSSMAFENISYSPDIPKDKFDLPEKIPTGGTMMKINQPMDGNELSKRLGFKVSKPGYIPDGYTFAGYQLYRCQCFCEHNAAHLRYTDGLNSISIFQVSKEVKCESSMCRMEKKTHNSCEIGDCRQAQVGRTSLKDKNVIVVADLPQEEIERIARSIK